MNEQEYSEREAGAKTFWVIEFVSQVGSLSASEHPPKVNFISSSTPYLPKCNCSHQLGVSVDENSELKQVSETKNLCDSTKNNCEKFHGIQENNHEQSSFINEQIESLGRIIQKFNDILSEFNRNKEDESN